MMRRQEQERPQLIGFNLSWVKEVLSTGSFQDGEESTSKPKRANYDDTYFWHCYSIAVVLYIETIATLLLLQYAPIVKTVYSGLSGGIGGSRLLAQNKSL